MDEEADKISGSPLKFSDFLYKKERHHVVMKIILKGKEA